MNRKNRQTRSVRPGIHVPKPKRYDTVRSDSISQKALPNGIIERTILEQVIDADSVPNLNQVLVSNPDGIDAIATAAMISIRHSKKCVPDPVKERATTIIDAIKEKSLGWKPVRFPTPDCLWKSDAEYLLSAFIFSYTTKFKAKIAMMRKWLLTGHIPEIILEKNNTNRANAIAKISSFSATLSVRKSGVATIDLLITKDTIRSMPDHYLMLGFYKSPVVVLRALIAVPLHSSDRLYRFDAMNFICAYDNRYLDVEDAVDAINGQGLINGEKGWEMTSFGLLDPVSAVAISPPIHESTQTVSQSILHVVEDRSQSCLLSKS